MKKIIGYRQTGKTFELIKLAEKLNAYIIVSHRQRALEVARQAKNMGYKILFPVTVSEYKITKFRGSYVKDVLIDDTEDVLATIFNDVVINAVTISSENSEYLIDHNYRGMERPSERDLIIRQDAIEKVLELNENHCSNDTQWVNGINALPAVNTEQRTGKWVHEPGMIPKCPFCGNRSEDADMERILGKALYCSHCGAKLED